MRRTRSFSLSRPAATAWGRLLVGVGFCYLLSSPFPARGASPSDRIAPRVIRVLEDPGMTPAPDETHAVWVYFIERSLSGPALERALDQAEARLSTSAAERRERNMGTTPRIVDRHDLPVDPAWISEVAATGATLRRASRLLNAASFDATGAQIEAIADLAVVDRVDLVALFQRSVPESLDSEPFRNATAGTATRATGADLNYGGNQAILDQIGVPPLHQRGLSGEGVTVALFDTGFELTHECLQGLDLVAAYDFVDDDTNVGQQPGDPDESAEHGTHMLGILAGFSPGNLIGPAYRASVILARTEDIGGETSVEEDNWIAALEWAEGLGVDVVSSSVGYYSWYDFSDLDGDTAAITIAADLAALRGVAVVVSAGNERGNPDWDHIVAPADGRHVIAVGGVDPSGYVLWLSSPGPTADGRVKPDVMAPAYGNLVPHAGFDDIYHEVVGVDAAVPLVAGIVALLREQTPNLTPLQIADALRETASRSLLPDNDYGWGLANALASLSYWAPEIRHEPLPDIEPSTESFQVSAEVLSRVPLLDGTVAMHWRAAGIPWQRETMSEDSGIYTATIPVRPQPGTVEYMISAANELGLTSTLPQSGASAPFRIEMIPDTTAPVISHHYLPDQTVEQWPPTVSARVEDASGIDRVHYLYSFNGGALQGPLTMERVGDHYESQFPAPASLPAGVEVSYWISAVDGAAQPNAAILGPSRFRIVESRGRVALVNNRYEPLASGEADDSPAPVRAAPDLRGALQVDERLQATSFDIADWIREAGFEVDILKSEFVRSSTLLGYDVVMYTTGNSLSPLSHEATVGALVHWAQNGGRLLIEGGDIAYAVDAGGLHQEFKDDVLHIEAYAGDEALELRPVPQKEGHAIVNRPHALPSPLPIVPLGFVDFGASDAVLPADDASVALHPIYGSSMGGVLVVDEDTGPDGGRIVYLPIDISRVFGDAAPHLIENALTYLTVRESEGPSTISGRVQLSGAADHAGATVRAGRDYETTTAADGSYSLEGLWAGTYPVEVEAPGFGAQSREVILIEGAEVSGVDFELAAVIPVNASATPDLPIPDNQVQGISSDLVIGQVGSVSRVSVDVDISHYSVGHLRVTLRSPSGTTVGLQVPSDDLTDDLAGNWPQSLVVEGPGSLEDFLGEDVSGSWTMTVADIAFGATGRFNSWGINFEVVPPTPSAADPATGRRTRLVGNYPNPLNPRTTIEFELARPGSVRLAVYDARGRLVRGLIDEHRHAGSQHVVWDGTDSSGAGTASGVYFVRLVADGTTDVHKMVLVR